MRVLLLGATGNLGSRVLPALLAHKHHVTALVRSASKLQSLVSAALIAETTVISGDATDSAAVKKAILDNDCDAIVDTAGNQVWPWQEHLLSKIARAVADAAVAVGKERGRPMRAWFIGGMGLLRYPGTFHLIQNSMPKYIWEQHQSTCDVLDSVPLPSLQWSLLCVAIMVPVSPHIERLDAPRTHGLVLAAGVPPEWKNSWIFQIPLLGRFLNVLPIIPSYTTNLEDVADFLAEDLESGSALWLGKRVGFKQREKAA